MNTSSRSFFPPPTDSPGERLSKPLPQLRFRQWLLGIFLSIIPLIIPSVPAYSYLAIFDTAEGADAPKPIQIQQQTLVISKELQQKIASQIPELDRQLEEQFKLFSIPIDRRMNLVYLHQGQEYWKIEFIYGGYLLNTSDETIYTTQEIFRLKQDFRSIGKIDLAGRTYDTNGSMQQLGPILHDGATGC